MTVLLYTSDKELMGRILKLKTTGSTFFVDELAKYNRAYQVVENQTLKELMNSNCSFAIAYANVIDSNSQMKGLEVIEVKTLNFQEAKVIIDPPMWPPRKFTLSPEIREAGFIGGFEDGDKSLETEPIEAAI